MARAEAARGSRVPGRLVHIAVVVRELEPALAFYEGLLGMTRAGDEIVEAMGVRAVFLAPPAPAAPPAAPPAPEIELLLPTREDSTVAKFLARRGTGLHHLAFEVPDLEAALADCRARGLRLVDATPRPGARGHRVAFLHPEAAGGVLVELIGEPGGESPA